MSCSLEQGADKLVANLQSEVSPFDYRQICCDAKFEFVSVEFREMSMDWRDDLHFIAWRAICEKREGRCMTDEELRLIQKERSVYRGPKYIDRYVKLHDPFRRGDLELQIKRIEEEYQCAIQIGDQKNFLYSDFARAGDVGHEIFYRHELFRWRFGKYCEQNYNYDFNQVEQQLIEGCFSRQTSHSTHDITLWDPKKTKLKFYRHQLSGEDAKLENKMSLGENSYLFHFDDKRLGKQWHSGYHFRKGPFGPSWSKCSGLDFRIRGTSPQYCNMYVPTDWLSVENFVYQADSDTEELYCDE